MARETIFKLMQVRYLWMNRRPDASMIPTYFPYLELSRKRDANGISVLKQLLTDQDCVPALTSLFPVSFFPFPRDSDALLLVF